MSALLQCCELAYREFGIPRESPLWQRIQELALMSAQLWRRPDQGIWDSRFRPEHYLSSKVACWRGLQSAISLFTETQGSAPKRWLQESQRLRETVIREGFNHSRQAYTGAFGELELDSSALLVGLWGIQSWDSPEVLSTLILIESELREGMFLRRNKSTHSSSDFDGAHLLSTLWWISTLIEVGRSREATELLTEICRISAPYGLLAEGIEPSSGAPVGDFPSSRVHSVFIQTALRASKALERPLASKAAA
ncbi:hypothetical protein EBZ37_00565 [bacterium]|nr:hypothetical protein [bacterium]